MERPTDGHEVWSVKLRGQWIGLMKSRRTLNHAFTHLCAQISRAQHVLNLSRNLVGVRKVQRRCVSGSRELARSTRAEQVGGGHLVCKGECSKLTARERVCVCVCVCVCMIAIALARPLHIMDARGVAIHDDTCQTSHCCDKSPTQGVVSQD